MSDPTTIIQPSEGGSVGGDAAGRPVGTAGTRIDISERRAWSVNGFLALLVGIALFVAGALLLGRSDGGASGAPFGAIAIVVGVLVLSSLTVVAPGETRVIVFFGRYLGTLRRTGLQMVVPLTSKRRVSVRALNFETNELKVNDADGNPINIAAIVVWQVADTARATFAVENYVGFVRVQAESALRHVAMSHPYDNADEGLPTLRGDTEVIAGELAREVAARIVLAGLEVIEVRISSLSYAPEIAQAMLQRQQAAAIIAARQKIVEGAVGMVESALDRLEAGDIVALDDERKASMVSNLLVVLCSEHATSPVINAGTLYG